MSRKTIKVKEIIEMTNDKTRQSYKGETDAKKYGTKLLPYMTREYRLTVQAVCREVMSLTENYNGFYCLTNWEDFKGDDSLLLFHLPE